MIYWNTAEGFNVIIQKYNQQYSVVAYFNSCFV